MEDLLALYGQESREDTLGESSAEDNLFVVSGGEVDASEEGEG